MNDNDFENFLASQKPVTTLSEIEMKLILFKILRHDKESFIYKHLFIATISFIIIYAFTNGGF
jgi:hypothetical protein